MIGNQHVWAGAAAAGLVAAVLLRATVFTDAGPTQPPVSVGPLLSSGESIVGERIVYPGGPARVTAAVVTLAPGQETGWHRHGMPVLGYVIEGELEVDYGSKGVRVYRAGDAVLEAIAVPHNGRNIGRGPMRILAVFMGAEGLSPTTPAVR